MATEEKARSESNCLPLARNRLQEEREKLESAISNEKHAAARVAEERREEKTEWKAEERKVAEEKEKLQAAIEGEKCAAARVAQESRMEKRKVAS